MDILDRVTDAFDRRVVSPMHRLSIGVDPDTGLRRRRYASYDEYVRHQSAKLSRNMRTLLEHDRAYEAILTERYANLPMRGKTVLCLGARLGGEVRAFTSLGALAIGVDLEPGPDNALVLRGDVHHLQFADHVFDYAFTNILDHVFDVGAFMDETARVLRPGRRFIVEIAAVGIGRYEVNDLSDGKVKAMLDQRFRLLKETPIHNRTDYTDWNGVMAIYETSDEAQS